MTEKKLSIRSYVRKGRIVNTVAASLNTSTGQMTEMTQRKKQRGFIRSIYKAS